MSLSESENESMSVSESKNEDVSFSNKIEHKRFGKRERELQFQEKYPTSIYILVIVGHHYVTLLNKS